MTNPDTFNSLQSWFEGIKEENEGKEIKGWLIGNKTDLEARIKISSADGQAFASEVGLEYAEMSAMKIEEVQYPFVEMAKEFYSCYESRVKQLLGK
mmetsp:Transcript_9179/g.10356  ORF Transcript_9179/g.10356 Transcript_9179/m.10356 type:complete len:96 (+) Transcript_9179:291-578(+)|eukprot:CAMPEP_0168336970 /NCGR_PEP_ID=MMETSP0213-20121227/11878_1 /TAXON_ID=151035 /ORGANISM="Euplotes harpa, Strain FSP1.4" /LENGTH=95 /DNA_ID=CAMNT_0008342303 /DNA_START=270 /DNA_END=557 /DNA_ORIENTATION=+